MQKQTNRQCWPWIVAGSLGVAIVLLSLVWPILFPPQAVWSPEKAKEYTKVGARLHALNVQLSAAGENPKTREENLKALEPLRREHRETQEQWETLREELATAKQRGQSTQTVLLWTGAALAVLGMVGWLATRESQ